MIETACFNSGVSPVVIEKAKRTSGVLVVTVFLTFLPLTFLITVSVDLPPLILIPSLPSFQPASSKSLLISSIVVAVNFSPTGN